MSKRDYVWEKMSSAISSLCQVGTFEDRLANATSGALIRLNYDDLDGDLVDDLKLILDWTKSNMKAGIIQRIPDDIERGQLIEKMISVMTKTYFLP